MAQKAEDKIKQFRIRTTKGVYVGSYDLKDQAEHDAKQRNRKAEVLDIDTRYEVTEK